MGGGRQAYMRSKLVYLDADPLPWPETDLRYLTTRLGANGLHVGTAPNGDGNDDDMQAIIASDKRRTVRR